MKMCIIILVCYSRSGLHYILSETSGYNKQVRQQECYFQNVTMVYHKILKLELSALTC